MRLARFILLFMVVFSLGILPVAGEGYVSNAMVTKYSLNPPILYPDGLGTLTVVITQIGGTSTQEVLTDEDEVEYTINWEDTVDIDEVRLVGNGLAVMNPVFDHIGEISKQNPLTITFFVRAPAQGGMYYPEVRLSTSGGSSRYPIPVNVDTAVGTTKQAIISLTGYPPGTVNPGDEIPIRMVIRNDGKTLADDLILKIGGDIEGIGTKTANVAFLGILNPGEQKTTEITLLSDRNTDPGLIHVPVTLQYIAIDGAQKTESALIDVVMMGEAELGFVSVDTSPRRVTERQPFDITIRIENTGTGQAKQVLATIDLPMAGNRQSYIGKIDPGNDAPAVFLMDGGPEGTYTCTATITYMDDTGTHTEVREMSLRVIRDESVWLGLLILLIGAVCAVLIYTYWYLPRKRGGGGFPWTKKG